MWSAVSNDITIDITGHPVCHYIGKMHISNRSRNQHFSIEIWDACYKMFKKARLPNEYIPK